LRSLCSDSSGGFDSYEICKDSSASLTPFSRWRLGERGFEMTQSKQTSSSDSFLLAVDFRLEGRNLRGIVLRLLGVMAAAIAVAAKVWLWLQTRVS